MRYRSRPVGSGVGLRILACFIAVLTWATAHAGELDCGPLKNFNDFGPFDYQDPSNRVPTPDHPMGLVKRVENVHFTPEMRAVNTKELSVERLTGEYEYTLRVFPNHPEALYAVSKLEKLAKGRLPQQRANIYVPKITAECFFDRAIRFRPDDPNVRFMHAMYLHDRKRLSEARQSYAEADRLGITIANFYYNYGLLLTDLKDYQSAREFAQKAYAGGFPLEGLRRRLTDAGFAP